MPKSFFRMIKEAVNWKLFIYLLIFPIILTVSYFFFKKGDKDFFTILDFLSSMTAIPAIFLTCIALYRIDDVRDKIKSEINLEGLLENTLNKSKADFNNEYSHSIENELNGLLRNIELFFKNEEFGYDKTVQDMEIQCRSIAHKFNKIGYIEYCLKKTDETFPSINPPFTEGILYTHSKYNELMGKLNNFSKNFIIPPGKIDLDNISNLSSDITELKTYCGIKIKEIINEQEAFNASPSPDSFFEDIDAPSDSQTSNRKVKPNVKTL